MTTMSAALDKAMQKVAQDGHNEEIRRLRARGANVNTTYDGLTPNCGWTPVLWAVCYNRVESLRVLYELGADVDKCNALAHANRDRCRSSSEA